MKNIQVPDANTTNYFNLRDYVKITGNNYYVDGSINEEKDDYKKRIKIVGEKKDILDFGTIRVHSFIQGKVDNISVVIHHVGRDECAPSSYQVFIDNEPATAEVDILNKADVGYFDQIIWNEQFYIAVAIANSEGKVMIDLVSLRNFLF